MNVGGALIQYSGLAPITDNGSASNRIFQYTAAGGTITVAAASGMPGFDTISANTGENGHVCANPTASLEVDANTGSNSITVNQLDSGFNAGLTLNATAAATSAITLNTSYSAGATRARARGRFRGGNISVTALLLNVSAVPADTISLTAPPTSRAQPVAAAITGSQLTTSSATGTALSTATNAVGTFNANNSSSASIAPTNAIATPSRTSGISCGERRHCDHQPAPAP